MLRNNYLHNDEYMYFSFDGVHSSKYNLFIQNNNDLTIENSVGESSGYVSALFQEGSYYTGTKKSQKTFKRKCAAGGLTLSQYKEMMLWLSTGHQGFLVFDYNPWWGWTVVLDSVGDATVMERGGKLLVEFDITFKTIGSYFARNRYAAYYTEHENGSTSSTCNGLPNETMMCNEFGIPVVFMEDAGNNVCNYFIQSVNNEHQHLDYDYQLDATNGSSELTITHNNINYITTKTKKLNQRNRTTTINNNPDIQYLGESNLILCDNELIEFRDDLLETNSQPYGVLQLPALTPKQVELEIDMTLHTIKFKNEDEFYTFINNRDYNYICLTRSICGEIPNTYWGEDEQLYPSPFQSFIMYKNMSSYNLDATVVEATNNGIVLDENVNSGICFGVDVNSQIIITEPNTLMLPQKVYEAMSKQGVNTIENFTCYIGMGNLVQIKLTGTTSNNKLTVTSCNNL